MFNLSSDDKINSHHYSLTATYLDKEWISYLSDENTDVCVNQQEEQEV